MKRIALFGALALVSIVPVADASGQKAKTTLTAPLYFSISSNPYFLGDIDSPKNSCLNQRKITLYRKVPGKDHKLGTSKSFSRPGGGGYIYQFIRHAGPGKYYAKVGATSKCKGDTSPTATVSS